MAKPKPEFVDWEIVYTKDGFKRMNRVRLWCVNTWWIIAILAVLFLGWAAVMAVLLWLL